MKENIFLVIKGFIMGIANVIPGVSGGTLALTLGIYEKLIKAISHFFKNLKDNIKFLLPLGIGMVLAVITMSNVIDYSFKKFPLPTTLFFMGLVIGGVPLLYKRVQDTARIRKKIIMEEQTKIFNEKRALEQEKEELRKAQEEMAQTQVIIRQTKDGN